MVYRSARIFSQVMNLNRAPRRHLLLAMALGLIAVAAFRAAPAQEERPSWRASAPERQAPPPEVEQPEFRFEIDRSSLNSPNQFKIRGSTPMNGTSAAPELGRVATWRERRSGTTRSASSNTSRPGSDEPDEEPASEQVITASIAPPAKVTEPAAEPAELIADGFQLAPSNPVRPDYPREALLDRTEGWVDVEMSVAPDGQVIDARIIDAEPRRVFERSALRAAGSWEFEPPAAAGINEIQRGVYRFEFNMDG